MRLRDVGEKKNNNVTKSMQTLSDFPLTGNNAMWMLFYTIRKSPMPILISKMYSHATFN